MSLVTQYRSENRSINIVAEVICVAAVVFSFATVAFNWSSLPATVPTHVGENGVVDAYGDKRSLWTLPIVNLAVYLGLSLLNRFPAIFNYPRNINEDNEEIAYGRSRSFMKLIKAWTALVLAYNSWGFVRLAQGGNVQLGTWDMIVTFIGYGLLIAAYMIVIRRIPE